MTSEPDIVDRLVRDLRPVRRLRGPGRRLLAWLTVSAAYAVVVLLVMGPRVDLAARLEDPSFVLEVGAPLVTAVFAGFAALCSGYPGRPSWELLAPLPPALLWLGTLSAGCLATLFRLGPDGLAITVDLDCLLAIVLCGLVPAAALVAMVRKGAPIYPTTTMALTALAAAAFGAGILRLFHAQDASMMILVWQAGAVALLMATGALAGRSILRWERLQA